MNANRVSLWQRLRGNFAFLPAAALAAGVVAGFAMLWLDSLLQEAVPWPKALLATPEIARSALTAIATSSLTIAALAVSLTLAVLTHAGAQFSPRVLKTFLRDGISQLSIGLLLAVHAYSLVVMRGIGSVTEVPHVAVGIGVMSGFVSVGLLIYYLHHLATSLRASYVVAAIAADTSELLDEAERDARRDDEVEPWPPMPGAPPHVVKAGRSGYLQSADVIRIDEAAKALNAFASIEVRLGEFICEGECLATVWPAEAGPDLAPVLQAAAPIGDHPECEQDPFCGMSQLVDLALRALSPSLNDPHTAGLAVDRLGQLLARAMPLEASRAGANSVCGPHGRVRLSRRSAGSLIGLCLDPIRQSAGGQCLVFASMLAALTRMVGHGGHGKALHQAIHEQVESIARAIEAQVDDPCDRERLVAGVDRLRHALREPAEDDPASAQAEGRASGEV